MHGWVFEPIGPFQESVTILHLSPVADPQQPAP
jgi:hypothetical protein